MKALSLRQPWAHLVVHGCIVDGVVVRKPIENRQWNTQFRGEFLIHAAKAMTFDEYGAALTLAHIAIGREHHVVFPSVDGVQRGGIIGRARLTSVLPICAAGHCSHRWHMPGQFGFELADVRPTPFVPFAGMQKWFRVPRDVVARLGAAA